jgi:tetratricopeptide (TPR) repeat protein
MFVDDDPLPYEDQTTAAQTALDDLALAMDRLSLDNRCAALGEPTYLAVPPQPPLHTLAAPSGVATGNCLGGTAAGAVVQAGTIRGSVHLHANMPRRVPVPYQLPPDARLFTDRAKEVAWLTGHVEDGGVAVLVVRGAAGVGKSALAVRSLRATADRFPDGQLYANLGAFSPGGPVPASEVAAGFLRALGVAPRAVPTGLEERTALLRTLTCGKRISVLLDDAASAAQVRPLLLTAPGAVHVVTTRAMLSALALEEAKFRQLHPWPATTGRAMLRRALGATRVRAEREAALDLAELCGGLPLALAIAAARLVAHPATKIGALVEELTDEQHRLDALSLDEEEVAVAATFDGAYAQLPQPAARLYRALGACPVGFFDRHLAAAVLAGTPREAERQLALLAGRSLLADQGGAYRFHDLVRLHAQQHAERAEAAEREAVRTRLVDYYLSATTRAEELLTPSRRCLDRTYTASPPPAPFTDPAGALAWLEAQRANLMALLRYYASQSLDTNVWQLSDAMWPIWLRLRYPADRLEAQSLGLAAARACGHDHAVGRFLTSLAGTCASAGRIAEAVAYNEAALGHYERLGDDRGLAQACNGLAKDRLELGDVQLAEVLFTRALQLRTDLGYVRGAALSRQGLGRVALARGDRQLAARHFARSHQALAAEGDVYDAAWSLAWWAVANAALGYLEQALGQLAQALEAMVAAGSRFGQAGVRRICGDMRRDHGDLKAARTEYRAALELLEQVDATAAGAVRERLAALDGFPVAARCRTADGYR